MGLTDSSRFFCSRNLIIATLMLALTACGGGGGGDDNSAGNAVPPPANNGGSGGSNPPPVVVAKSLQSVLAACPNTFLINADVPCMEGVYEGKTTDTGAYCAFRYDSDGVSSYRAGTQTLRASIAITSSGAVFEKKAVNNAAGFAIAWSVGVASGNDMDLYYQSEKEPASANGLVVKPKKSGVSSCLLTSQLSSASGATNTTNLTGHDWQSPQLLNGSAGAIGYVPDHPSFEAGMADDGHAFVTYRQPDAGGRMSVYVVEGRPGAAGQSPSWTAPIVLDANAPLLTGNFFPQIAVSSTGHAVVMWMAELPCDADSYESSPAGKTCRYVYASRRLASDTAWEPAVRVRASRPMAAQDYFARINAKGDVVLAFPSFITNDSTSTASMLAIRHALDTSYRIVRLGGFWSNFVDTTPFAQRLSVNLDDSNNLFVVGKPSDPFGEQVHVRTTTVLAPSVLHGDVDTGQDGVFLFQLASSSGFAAYTSGPGNPATPNRLTVYSPTSQQWFAPYDPTLYGIWGDSVLVATDNPEGEFLFYSGCKVTPLRGGAWGTTRDLPEYCGGDRDGGIYAFNRNGDYLGINWAGTAGQWGFYSYTQNKMLKGAPGSGVITAGDLVLGTSTDLFPAESTQLLLAPNGLALALTTNTYTTLPSAANSAGVIGSAAQKLWAVYLK